MSKVSTFLQQCFELLSSIEGKKLSFEERKKSSIELASYLHQELRSKEYQQEQKLQRHQTALLKDPKTRSLLFHLIDQSFRSQSFQKTGNQIAFLLLTHGIPHQLPPSTHLKLFLFRLFRRSFPKKCISAVQEEIKKHVFDRVLPNPSTRKTCLQNMGLVDDLFLGYEERKKRIKIIKKLLENPEINYLTIRTIDLLPSVPLTKEESLSLLTASLTELFETAQKGDFPKFICLSSESYEHLLLAHTAFKAVLDLPAFSFFSAGITLPAYFPDSFEILRDLTIWARQRKAHIKITLVKGGFLGKEQITAAKKGWLQASFPTKMETDANFKKMMLWSLQKKHTSMVHIGVATHNLFDIAFFLVLQRENQISQEAECELFEKKSTTLQTILSELSTGPIRLFSPANPSGNLSLISSYVIQKMSSQIGQDTFFSSSFEEQEEIFSQSLIEMDQVSSLPRRVLKEKQENLPLHLFENEPTSFSFSMPPEMKFLDIYPISIGKEDIFSSSSSKKTNPSLEFALYRYVLATKKEVELALDHTSKDWMDIPFSQKSFILSQAAQLFRKKRKEFLFLLSHDGGKILSEASEEIDRTIDCIEYYRLRMEKQHAILDLTWEPKGRVLILSSWRQACLFPASSIAASLISNNTVLFKPSLQTIALSWEMAKIFWEAGVPKDAIQFIPTSDEIVHEVLLCPKKIQKVLFSGTKKTEEYLIRSHPGISFTSLIEGNNSMIITASADRKLALQNLVTSSFYHGGQDFFSTSNAIMEREVYEDLGFRNELRDAVNSLHIGLAFEEKTHIPYQMAHISEESKRSLYKLEKNEGWLLEPKFHAYNPLLIHPGIKLGITKEVISHSKRIIGPFLNLIVVSDFSEALHLANQIKNPLAVNLQSLDEREHIRWRKKIEGTNLTINVPTTGFGVRKTPFGSSPKIGGPNFLRILTHPKSCFAAQEKYPLNKPLLTLQSLLDSFSLTEEEKKTVENSFSSCSYWWHRMKLPHDPTKLLGQDNLFGYIPRKLTLRVDDPHLIKHALIACGSALACQATLEISSPFPLFQNLSSLVIIEEESESRFLDRLSSGSISFLRLISPPSLFLLQRAAVSNCTILDEPVVTNGRYELLHYVEEFSLTYDYHRHGYLGLREAELRKTPL